MIMNTQLLLACCLVAAVHVREIRGGSLQDENTTEQDTPICPGGFELFESSCYLLVSDSPTDGRTAHTACQELATGSHLAFIRSQIEQTFLQTLAEERGVEGDYWIGLTFTSDIDHPHWLDGSILGDFTAWDSYGDFDESSPCVRLRGASQYLWNDRPCSYQYGYICQAESIAADEASLTTPAPRPAPTTEAKPADATVGQTNMAAPTVNHLIQTLKSSSLLRCALYCLKHGGCSDPNYQAGNSAGRPWVKLRSFCELYPKGLPSGKATEKTGLKTSPILKRW